MRLPIFALVAVSAATAQQPPRLTIHGVAYDSLRGAPLQGAFIGVTGTNRSAISDSLGNFRFDSVAPGTYTFTMQHDALDSLGMTGRAIRAVVTDGRDTIRIAVPSFATFWNSACGPGTPPRDSGLIYGTIRGANGGRPVPKATVNASWIDVGFDKEKGVTQRRWHLDVESDPRGGYALCGVPGNVATRLIASTDSAASGLIDLPPRDDRRIQRRDLILGPLSASATVGIVIGKLHDAAGNPVAAARVQSDGVPEVRSGPNGTFIIRGLAAGTRQIDVLSIGTAPASAIVDVAPPDTASIDLQLTKVTTLADVKVTATTMREIRLRDIDDRKKAFIGRYLDSTVVGRSADFRSAVSALVPNCLPTIWIDGIQIQPGDVKDEFRSLNPREIALLEFYHGIGNAPQVYRPNKCGLLIVWTKRFFG